jgi:hypothetical protein
MNNDDEQVDAPPVSDEDKARFATKIQGCVKGHW